MKNSIERLTIPLDDSRNLHTWVIRQPAQSEKLAVLMPGYLDSKDYPHLIGLGEFLAERGFDVISFNPFGTWETVDHIAEFTVGNYVSNVESAIQFMEQSGTYKKIIVGGHSLGGMISLLYAAETVRENIAAVMAIMSPYAFIRMENYQQRVIEWGAQGYKDSERVDPINPEKKFVSRVPFSFVETSQHYNLLNTVQNVHQPILFIAGAQDDLITPAHVQKVFDKANQPKELVIVDAAHNYREQSDQINKVNEVISDFLTRTGV